MLISVLQNFHGPVAFNITAYDAAGIVFNITESDTSAIVMFTLLPSLAKAW